MSDLDLELTGGAFFGLLGPNGAGKTTLIGSLCNIVRPTAGCSPVDRCASCAAGGPELPCLPTVVAVMLRPVRWCARHGPLSAAGSFRPSPERQSETTPADRGGRDGVTVAASEVCYPHPDSHHRQIMHPGTAHFHAVSLTSADKDTDAQTLEVLEIAPMGPRPCRLDGLGRRIGSRQADNLVTCVDELRNNR